MSAEADMDAAALAALVLAARRSDAPERLAEALPYLGFLGITVARHGDGLRASMAYSDALIGDSSLPALHGGTIGALLESSALFEVLWATDAAVLPRTVTLTIDYLRSGRPCDTHCRATIVRQGRRIVVVSARAYQDREDEPIATATVHVLLANDRAAEE